MKRLASLFLVLAILLSGCGGKNRDYNIESEPPPKKLFKIAEKTEESITLLAENSTENEVTYNLRFRFQKQEGDRWVLIKPLNKEEIVKNFTLQSGETTEIGFDFKDMFGRLSDGTYRMVATKLDDSEYRNQWYERHSFKIEGKENSSEIIDVTAESVDCTNIEIRARIKNNSEKEITLTEYWELYIETEKGFEKLDHVRGASFGDAKIPILPGEYWDYHWLTDGIYGALPKGKYRADYFVEFSGNGGNTSEQTVSMEFEITGLEENNIVPILEKTAEVSGTEITVTFKNDWGLDIRFGEDYVIQKSEGEEWVTVEPKMELAFDMVLYTLASGETAEWKTDFEAFYGKLPKGNYRLLKSCWTDADNYSNGEHMLIFEFAVK